MIRIQVLTDEHGRTVGFDASGHAFFSDPGSDIVCAAVSALLQTALLGLEKSARVQPRWSISKGRLHCEVPPTGRTVEGARVLLESIIMGLKKIDERSPGYIRIEEKLLRPRSRVLTPR